MGGRHSESLTDESDLRTCKNPHEILMGGYLLYPTKPLCFGLMNTCQIMLTKTNRNVERVHDFVMIFDEVGDSVLIKSLDKVSLSTRWKRTIPGAADNQDSS